MGQPAVAYSAGELERAPRLKTREHCVITRSDGITGTAILLNISERGFCVESAAPLTKDDIIQVRVLGTSFRGTVRWADGCRAGGTLHQLEI